MKIVGKILGVVLGLVCVGVAIAGMYKVGYTKGVDDGYQAGMQAFIYIACGLEDADVSEVTDCDSGNTIGIIVDGIYLSIPELES
ncbi:MAG: hypothetical protein LUG25_03565 [Oscillospiraceae bacterium]|nr:hypothetical protein [Oscillospiraceae bacterium]